MSRALKIAACMLGAAGVFLACSSNVGPDRGGLVVTVENDGTLQLDRLKVLVSSGDQVLLQNEYAVPDTVLPNTLSIVSNGSGTTTATVSVSGWLNGLPVDRRDAIVTQIPVDRVASLGIVLSAKCTKLVKAGADPTTAESTCPAGQTCDPTPAVAVCVSDAIDASGLPDWHPGDLPGSAGAEGGADSAMTPTGDGGGHPMADGEAACDPTACAAKLKSVTMTPEGCAEAYCDTATNACAFRSHDADGDGARATKCSAPGMTIQTGNDCDDTDKNVHAGTTAQCAENPDGTPVTFPTPTPQGICSYGTKLCQPDGTFAACAGVVAPKQVDCTSAADNNCNGVIDNTTDCGCANGSTQACYDGAAGTSGHGPCHGGTRTCAVDASGTKTAFGPCVGEVLPAAHDTCVTGNDNSCNGIANEGCTCRDGQTTSCGSGVGARGTCSGGSTTCNGSSWPGFFSGCSIGAAAHDTCVSGNDDSCNGAPNEGCGCLNGQTQGCNPGYTACSGSQQCNGTSWPGAYGGCGTTTCGDFSVVLNVDNACGPACFSGTTCNFNTANACPAGYHVTGASVADTGGHGTCSFTGATGRTVLWSGNVGGCDGTHCLLQSCTCHRDGF